MFFPFSEEVGSFPRRLLLRRVLESPLWIGDDFKRPLSFLGLFPHREVFTLSFLSDGKFVGGRGWMHISFFFFLFTPFFFCWLPPLRGVVLEASVWKLFFPF